ncbi:MAG TPA: hypothetical protein VLA31_03225 [Burkholderiaceae bacterium]|nr:hypothetical protein [Burkholderiaceae bacterium]
MTKQPNHQEAIARISAVAKEIADREAAAAQAELDRKAKRKAAIKARKLANPEKAREAQRKKNIKRDDKRKQRMAIDPVYAAKVRAQRQKWYLQRKERLGLDHLNKLAKESQARMKAADPDGFQERQKHYKETAKQKQKARMEVDPAYAKEVRAKRRAKNKEKHQKLVAEVKALRALVASLQANPSKTSNSCDQ